MNRRELFALVGKLGLLASPLAARLALAFAESPPKRDAAAFFLIHDSRDPDAPEYRALLEAAEPYLRLQRDDWRSALSVWDVRDDSNRVAVFVERYGPNTRRFDWPALVAVDISDPSEEEVEIWNTSWLEHHRERFTKACYPISGGWWSVEGDWNPTTATVRAHVGRSPNHAAGKFQTSWLGLLKFAELQSLHSDHHREMIKKGKVHWKQVNRECAAAS